MLSAGSTATRGGSPIEACAGGRVAAGGSPPATVVIAYGCATAAAASNRKENTTRPDGYPGIRVSWGPPMVAAHRANSSKRSASRIRTVYRKSEEVGDVPVPLCPCIYVACLSGGTLGGRLGGVPERRFPGPRGCPGGGPR